MLASQSYRQISTKQFAKVPGDTCYILHSRAGQKFWSLNFTSIDVGGQEGHFHCMAIKSRSLFANTGEIEGFNWDCIAFFSFASKHFGIMDRIFFAERGSYPSLQHLQISSENFA